MSGTQSNNSYYVYVGSYARSDEPGIRVFEFSGESGELTCVQEVAGVGNPSFLTLNEQDRVLYAVSEVGKEEAAVVSWSVLEDGSIQFLNSQPTDGAAPCHVTWLPGARALLATNYMGGNVTVFPVESSGALRPASDNVWHQGKGPRADRQEGPHPHSVFADPTGQYLMVQDLGLDKVVTYRLEGTPPKLQFHADISTAPGAGPRHIAFHPSGKFAYLINELDNTIVVYTYDASSGQLSHVETVSALPDSFQGESYCADIHVSPCGRYLYGSNRGHDSIVVFRINEVDGSLTYVQHQSTLGQWPRNFAISPDGNWLLVANERSDSVVTFRIDSESGRLLATGKSYAMSKPVCIQFIKEWT